MTAASSSEVLEEGKEGNVCHVPTDQLADDAELPSSMDFLVDVLCSSW